MRIRTDYPSQSLRVWVGRDIRDTQDPVLDVWLGYTPLDAEQKTNRTFGYLSVKRPPVPGFGSTRYGRSLSSGSRRIFSPKTRTSWSTSSALTTLQGGDWNNEVFPAIRRSPCMVLANCGKPMDG